MRRLALALVLLATLARASDWTPHPDRRYRLAVGGASQPLGEADQRWADELVARLRAKGGVVESAELVSAATGSRIEVNGAPSTHRVFKQGDSGRYLVVSIPDSHSDSYLVDFERKVVLQCGGIWTTSIHPHPSGRFAVVIYTHRPLIYGVPVGGPPDDPSFGEAEASWY